MSKFEKIKASKRKKEEDEKKSSSVSSNTNKENSNFARIKASKAKNRIGFDTFQTDLEAMGKTISGIYGGWQSPETMKTTRSSIEAMQKRINAYQDYQKEYGCTDISELANGYSSILGEWDALKEMYGGFENADAFNKAKKTWGFDEKYKGKTFDEIQSYVTELEGKQEKAKQDVIAETKKKPLSLNFFNTEPSVFDRTITAYERSGVDPDELNYLKNYANYSTTEDFDKALKGADENSDYAMALRRGKNAVQTTETENGLRSDANFETYVKQGEALGNEKKDGAWSDHAKVNMVEYLRKNPNLYSTPVANGQGSFEEIFANESKLAKYGTKDQIDTYNALMGQGHATGNYENADRYLYSILEGLNSQSAEDFYNSVYKGKPFLETLASPFFGTANWAEGVVNNFNDGDYIPYSETQLLQQKMREDVTEAGAGWQVAYDLGTTVGNMSVPILASTATSAIPFVGPYLGKGVGAGLMGLSARGNAYQEKLNEGWTKESASTYGNLVGTSETAMSLILSGVGQLGGKVTNASIKAIANGIDNAYGRFFATMGIKGGSEFLEESFQTVAEPFFENLALGYAKNSWNDVDLKQAAYDGMLGFLSAFVLEGGGTAVDVFGENHKAKKVGATIRENEMSGKMFDIASLTPQESDAYNLYTAYAKKGVNAENASDLQLGRLWVNSKRQTQEVLGTKKMSNAEAELKAVNTNADLDYMAKKKSPVEVRVAELTTETDSKKPLEEGTSIKGIKLGEDTKIVTDKGEMSLSEVSLPERQAQLVAFAEQMPENEANLFIEQYDGTSNVERYADSFNLAVNYSKNAMPQETILENKGTLTERQVAEIYKATRTAVVQENQKALDNITQKHSKGTFLKGTFDDAIIDYKSATTDGSKVNWKDLTSRQRSAIKFAKMFSKATGVNIRFIQSEVKNGKRVGKNGSYDPNTNTIEIDVYAGIDGGYVTDAIIPTLSHEVTHWAKAKSPAIYESIKNELVPFLAKKEGKTIDGLVAEEMARMKKAHPGMEVTPESAMDELVARACEDMLTNSNRAKALLAKMTYKERNDFVGKIQTTLKNLIEWADELLSYYKSETAEAKLLRQYRAELKKVSKMWDEMLVSAVEANQALQKEGITGEQLAKADSKIDVDEEKYSIREEYVNEIDAWVKDGKPNGESFILGTTGDVLQGLGAIESDIYMLSDKINEILSDHPEITIDEIKKIPQILDDPVLVLKSKKIKSRLVMFGSVKAQNGKPILVALDLRPYEKGFMLNDMQKVNSAYTKTETFNRTAEENGRELVKTSEILYVDKKRTTHLLSAIGFYMPITCNQSGYIGSISYEGDNVKIKGEEFSKVFKENGVQNSDRDSSGNTLTKEQVEYFKDSKVRDENGNLLVMYRGDSNNEFTVFDRKKSKYSNLYGRGFYFTSSKAHAEQYGKAREFYLDIKNPLIREQNNITKEQMLNFLKAIENDGEDYDLYNYGQDARAESVLESVWGKGDYEMIQDINAGAIGDLVAAIELFNEVNGTSYDGIILPTETITFKSEQAKLTSNKAPTENEDIRFSMRENVEETKELVAVHNMRVSELERTLDLGGLPMPSIAIIKAEKGHSEYGDVSLVFPKSTIDPKANRNNKVYGGDAWTPVYPKIEYKPSAKVAKKISDKYYELSRKFGYDESRPLYNYVYDLEEQLNRHKGEAELLEELYDDQSMMQLYLLDSGKNKVETVQKEIRTELTDAEVEMHEFFIKELGAEVVDAIVWDGNGTPMSYRKNYLSKYEDAIRDAYKKLLTDVYHFEENQVQTVLDGTKSADIVRFMREANKYRQNGRVTTKTEADYEATKQAIKEASGDGYRAWVDSLFKGVEEKSGIRNNTDYFTNSGNRRSWEALHWENNLENVIKVMKSQDNGEVAFFSGQAIWGVSAKDYRSVEEIKADANRLQQLPEEEYNKIKEGFGERLSEIASSIMDKTERNHFIAVDNAMECIVDALRHSKTKSGLLSYLKQFRHLTVTETNVSDIVSLVTDISNMPTEYFEAKPRRAVELNEIATAIIPDNTSESTKTRLNDMGIKFVEYENGNEESRLNALNSLEDLKFSDRMTETVYDKMGETKRLEKETARLKKDLGRLKERLGIEGKVTGGTAVLSKDTDIVARHIDKIANSTFNTDKLSADLKEFYTYLRQSSLKGTWNDEAVFAKAYELAESVLTEAKPKTTPNDYAKFLLREIRSKRIRLSDTQIQEAKNAFGDKYRNAFWGKVTIANDGISLDSQWQEWSATYPDFFKADVTEGDQITELHKIYDALRDASEVVEEYNAEEQTRWLAEEIINKCWTLPVRYTIADKYDAQIKALNFEHRQAMKEMRDDFEDRQKELHKADKAKYKDLVQKIRDRKDAEIAEAKKLGKERLDKYKENAERKTKIQSITANALTLNKWLTKNSKEEHIHEAMKAPVVELLQAIDFSSKQLLGMLGSKNKGTPTQKDISLSKALGKVKDMLVSASNTKGELVELYGHGLDEEIAYLADSVDNIMREVGDNEFVLNKMSLEELNSLDKVVSTIKHAVTKLNKFHTINHSRGIANLSQESMSYLDSLGMEKLYKGLRGSAKKLLNWGNALPYYAFKRYGEGGRKVFEAFQNGWDKFAFHIKKIMDYANDTYTSKEVKEWEKDIKEFKIRIPATDLELADPNYKPQYQKVQITVPQIMSLYCLQKREQAKGHILGGGIRVANIETKKGEIISQPDGVTLTVEDISTMISSLTSRQIEVADKLQTFMNTICSDWGNEVSMLRFGYKAFGEENYFPIQSDKNNLEVDNEETKTNSLFALLNMSFAKSTIEGANNRIVIGNIFDIFAQHTSDMAKYNALALPVLDAFKWYNYTEKEPKGNGTFITTGVKQSLEKAFGKDGVGYFTTFLKDMNGEKEVSRDTLGKHFFTSAKVASVAANLRVMFLQPTSYVRANAIINNLYLTKALIHKPKIKMAEKYCGMALWKSMGYYDTNIQKGVEEQIKHNKTWKDKTTNFTLKGAEWADKLTWGYLWNACELEVRKTRTDLKVGSEEFYQTIGERLREIIYATQVVDSTMTRSQMMRSSQIYDKMLTAFASEPTLAYNMVQDAYMGYKLDERQMGKKEAIKKNGKKMARVVTAYTLTNALAALVESGFDAFRDDEDEEMDLAEFMKIYLSNFAYDMSLTAKIPYVKELVSILQGFSSSRTDTQWMQSFGYFLQGIMKNAQGKGSVQGTVKHGLRTLSYLSGLPFYNAYRDLMSALDKFGIFTVEELEEMFEDFLD